MDRFAVALRLVLEFEGGKTDDPADRGGRTAFGITQRTFDAWRAKGGGATSDVWTITPEEVAAIYRAEYWEAVGCDAIAPPLDLVAFDAAVNHGVSGARAFLSAAQWSDSGPELQAFALLTLRREMYRRIVSARPAQAKYLTGWLNRTDRVRREARL